MSEDIWADDSRKRSCPKCGNEGPHPIFDDLDLETVILECVNCSFLFQLDPPLGGDQ